MHESRKVRLYSVILVLFITSVKLLLFGLLMWLCFNEVEIRK